jgi:hypothetical protein
VLAYPILIGWDWGRYATYAFPVVMVAGAWTIQQQRRYRPLLLALVATQAVVPVVDFAAGRPSLDGPGPSLPISLLLILATIVVLVAGSRDRATAAVSDLPPPPEPVSEAAPKG